MGTKRDLAEQGWSFSIGVFECAYHGETSKERGDAWPELKWLFGD
jgi:hypothetical protein